MSTPRPDFTKQWSLLIDIEGFGATYDAGSQALLSLGVLMEGIYKIGSRCLKESPNRIFAHQIGDGFIVLGEFAWESLEEPLSVTVALLRTILMRGGVGKAALHEGQFADIVGCYPKVIQEQYARSGGGAFPLGGGLMTVFPVMGQALIDTNRLISAAPSGALLVIWKKDLTRLPQGVVTECSGDLCVLDWIHTSFPHLQQLLKDSALLNPEPPLMITMLERYLSANKLPEEWIGNTRRYLHLDKGACLPTPEDAGRLNKSPGWQPDC